MNIFLIAGHGAGDSGAVGNGFQEANLTREVVSMIPAYLSSYANVTTGDTNRDWFSWLKTNTFDFTSYDYVLEVHFNSGVNDPDGNGRVAGTEIFVTTGQTGVSVEANIVKRLEKLGFTNRGVKKKNFSVISKIERQGVAAALLEVAFIDDKDDMDLYQLKKHAIAQGIADGIIEGFGLESESGGLTMSQYEELTKRLDELEKKIGSGEMIYHYIDDNMPQWARSTIQKLADKAWLQGNENGELGLTDDLLRLLVINDRAGLYDA